MKLFHFYSVEALREWAAGDLVIMSENIEEAIKLLAEDEEIGLKVEKEIRENPDENVRIYENPKAIQIFGSA